MMKAAFLTKRPEIGGLADQLQVENISVPHKDDLSNVEVLVDVKASGVGVDDLHLAQGTMGGGLFLVQTRVPTEEKPLVLGSEFVGVVKEVGAKVTNVKIGDAVCGVHFLPLGHHGTWAETIVTQQSSIIRIPKDSNLSYAEWASLLMPGFVGTEMFKQGAITQRSESETENKKVLRCLVVGASGGIGSFLVQLLSKQSNVHVSGVCSSKNVEFVRGLGADDVFDYTQGSLAEQLEQRKREKFDRVFDLIGGVELEEEAFSALLANNGRFVSPVGPFQWIGSTMLSRWDQFKFAYHISIRPYVRRLFNWGKPTYHFAGPVALPQDLLSNMIDANIKPVVEELIPFETEQIRKAVRLVQSHRARGRVVLAIDPECTKIAR